MAHKRNGNRKVSGKENKISEGRRIPRSSEIARKAAPAIFGFVKEKTKKTAPTASGGRVSRK